LIVMIWFGVSGPCIVFRNNSPPTWGRWVST